MNTGPSGSPKPAKRKPWGIVIGGVAVAGAFAGGLLLGMEVVDPMESDEFQTVQASNGKLIQERDRIQADFDSLEAGIAKRESEVEKRTDELDERSGELEERAEDLASQEEDVLEREKAVGTIEAEQAANSVGDGVWTVGQDISAGTYRPKESVGSSCYWAVLKSGTNGRDIASNGIPGGGRPTVTVKKGQDFESKRCGTWVKQ
ncbi:hypothetical protein OK351_09045 [Glutamicibacter sp. MNS18]|uniref:hypothetical protein n=1 Tax=Glutamicibacter sp. MNS18 TaxID=2989817 RepID=UPI0022368F3F|nr:hypothetical protein [Glutamicibacter sp. MNS18]MCW4465651.1 hypothetical protein [Glutamicibacter sp. MNS18]